MPVVSPLGQASRLSSFTAEIVPMPAPAAAPTPTPIPTPTAPPLWYVG